MKAHRRILAVATMALTATLIAGPAHAGGEPPESEVSSSPNCYSMHTDGDRTGTGLGLGLIGVGLGTAEVLNLENVLNCNPILSDLHVLSNED